MRMGDEVAARCGGAVIVAESGIGSIEDINNLRQAARILGISIGERFKLREVRSGTCLPMFLTISFRDCLNLYDTDFERDCLMDFLLVMKERSRSYETEEQTKRRRQDSQKQSNMNFRQSLKYTTRNRQTAPRRNDDKGMWNGKMRII